MIIDLEMHLRLHLIENKPIFKISDFFSKMQIFEVALKSTIFKNLKYKLFFQFTASYR